jgi:hypothetical protein
MLAHKHFALSFVLFFSYFSTTANILIDSEYLQAWKASYLDHMTLAEKQMLANIIHLLHANSIIEFKIRQFSTPIAQLNQTIRTNIDQYKNVTEEIAMLKTLLDRLYFVVNTRTIYNQILSTSVAHYNKNTSPMIDSALTNLQLCAQNILRNWTNERTATTCAQLKKSSDNIANTIQHFQGISNLHKAMSEGNLPIQINPEDEENKALLILSIIVKNNPELLIVTENVVNALNETSDHAAQIVLIGAEIYKQFYTILYDILMSPICEQRYMTTLFSMHDVLPDEYKSLLPDPNHVFEHMLQTTKMYTQTEFSQP